MSTHLSGILQFRHSMNIIIIFNILIVLVFCVIWMTANTQHFCESYEENNQKMIVYNGAELDFLLFIIETKYWKIRIAEKGTELKFVTEDKLPIGSSDLLSDQYMFAINIQGKKSTTKYVAFYKVLNEFSIFLTKL